MDEELRALIARAHAIARTGEHLSAIFAAELAEIWMKAERALAHAIHEAAGGDPNATVSALRALTLQSKVRTILEQAGFDALIPAIVQTTASAFVALQVDPAKVVSAGAQTLDALQAIQAADLLAQGDIAATDLWRALVRQVLTTQPTREIVKNLADALDRSKANVQTLFDTQNAIFARQVEALATQDLPESQAYLYLGPLDSVTRDFCIELVGTVLTRSEIDKLDNGQLPDVFLTGGGYNCRHSWLAVESRELRELTNTGTRVESIQQNAERLAKLKAERKAKRKKAA